MKRIRQWLRVRLAYGLAYLPFWPAPANKFVVFGQGRTGSTLLVDLLNSSDDIHCDREIFNVFHFTGEKIRNPLSYVIGRSKRFSDKVYGFKVKIYQLKEDHKVHSIRDFLSGLEAQGYRIIYLSRENVLQHAYSNVKRALTGVTHVRDEGPSKGKIRLPVSDFMSEISLRLRFRTEELEVLKGFTYLHLSYERDLLQGEVHLNTINTVRKYLGLKSVNEVKSRYHKITDKSLAEEIANYDEVVAALQEAKLDSYIW